MKNPMLRPLSSKIPDYSIFAFDIETTGKTNDFLMGSIVGKDNKMVFWDKEEMINCLTNSRCFYKNARVFATNLSFDITALLQKTEQMKELQILLRGSRIIQARLPVKSHQKRSNNVESYKDIIFLDTMNFYPFSVKAMGEILKLPKLPMPDYIKEERMPRENEKDGIEAYNLRDSEITYGFASFLQDSFKGMGCKMRMTAASTALDLFKRRYLLAPMFQESVEKMKDEYKAYYGGRTEVFQRGLIEDANYYDFNSLYPSVMRNEYPDISYSNCKEKGSLDVIMDYHGISEVQILCPKGLNIPFLPFRKDMKLIFPTGIFKGWYSHIELRYALELGYQILNIGNQIYYTHCIIHSSDMPRIFMRSGN